MANCLVTRLKAEVDNPNLPVFGFHSITKALLNTFSVTIDESDDMQKAIDKFVRALNTANIWGNDKINGLCLPFITNLSANPNLNDAVLNCIDTTQTFFDNTYATKLELSNNGLVTKRTGENRVTILAGTNDWARAKNLHIASFSLADEPTEYTSSAQTDVAAKFIFSDSPFIGLRTDCQLRVTSSNKVYGDSNYSNKACMMLFGYNPSFNDSKVILYVNGQSVLSQSAYTTEETYCADINFGKYKNPYLSADNYPIDINPTSTELCGQVASPYGLLSVGKYLTSTEVEIYNSAANELITAVHTYMD